MASAGQFKYPIKIYHRLVTVNDFGEEAESYELVRQTKAAINFRTNQRTIQNSEIRLPKSYEILVRTYCEIDDTTQIEYDGKRYRVIEWHEDLDYRDKVIEMEQINT